MTSEIPDRTEEIIETIVKDSLYVVTGRYDLDFEELPRENLCDPVANEVAYTLEEEYGWTVKSEVYAPVNGSKHFVAVVVSLPDRDLETPFVIDGTISSFSEDYPLIVIESIDSKFVQNTYDYINL